MSQMFRLVIITVLCSTICNATRASDLRESQFATGSQYLAALNKQIKKTSRPALFLARARYFAKKHRLSESFADYQAAVKHSQSGNVVYENARIEMATIYSRFGLADAADDELKNASPSWQKSYLLGRGFQQRNNLDQAVRFYSEAIKQHPANPLLYHSRASALGTSRDAIELERAASDLRIAIALQETSQRWSDLGCCLRRLGKLIDSRDALQKAVRLDSQNAAAHFNLAVTFHKLGKQDVETNRQGLSNLEFAISHYRKAALNSRIGQRAALTQRAQDLNRELKALRQKMCKSASQAETKNAKHDCAKILELRGWMPTPMEIPAWLEKVKNSYGNLELSGLTNEHGGVYWAVADSGRGNMLHAFQNGKIIASFVVGGSQNVDWESVATDGNYLYVCDVGNNKSKRDDNDRQGKRVVYKINKPDIWTTDQNGKTTLVSGLQKAELAVQEEFQFEPKALEQDFEAAFVRGSKLYLLSKSHDQSNKEISKKTILYYLDLPEPTESRSGATRHLKLKEACKFECTRTVTGAALNTDGSKLALVSYDESEKARANRSKTTMIHLFDVTDDNGSLELTRFGRLLSFEPLSDPNGDKDKKVHELVEAIAFSEDSNKLILVSEWNQIRELEISAFDEPTE